uniref:Uncharacterized protein n=1 Tax=Parastrongyloides trichosuri TaxID=131310 RepID=A0A0N5A0Z8_PARTI
MEMLRCNTGKEVKQFEKLKQINFVETVWNEKKVEVMKKGLILKFSNRRLKDRMLSDFNKNGRTHQFFENSNDMFCCCKVSQGEM